MFASSPAAAAGAGSDRRRAWVLASSLIAHVALFATLIAVQTWHVEAVAEPPTNDILQVTLPPPLQAESAPAQHAAAAPPARHEAAVQPQPPRQSSVQPNTAQLPLPPLLPATPLVPLAPEEVAPPGAPVGPGGNGSHGTGGGSGGDGSGTGAGEGVDDGPLPIGGAIKRPEIIPGTKVQPVYTETARQAHLQGVVILQATIDERGNVIDARVLKPLPMGLDREAVKAVSQWKFTPATLHGRPVKVFFTVTVQYEAR